MTDHERDIGPAKGGDQPQRRSDNAAIISTMLSGAMEISAEFCSLSPDERNKIVQAAIDKLMDYYDLVRKRS